MDLFEGCSDREQGLACAGFAVDGDEGDVRVVHGIEEEPLTEIQRLQGPAAPDGNVIAGEWHKGAVLFVTSRDAVAGRVAVLDQNVLIGEEAFLFSGHLDQALTREGLYATSGKLERLVFLVAAPPLGPPDVVVILDPICSVVLRIQSEGACFELEVKVFCDEERGFAAGVGEVNGGGEDTVVGSAEVGEEGGGSGKSVAA